MVTEGRRLIIPVLFAFALFPLLKISTYDDHLNIEEITRPWYTAGIIIAICATFLFSTKQLFRIALLKSDNWLLVLSFYAICIFASLKDTFVSLDATRSLLYILLLQATLLILSALSDNDPDELPAIANRVIICILVFFCSLFIVFGSPQNRFFGTIMPNNIGNVASTLIIWVTLSRLRNVFKAVLFGIAIVITILVNSRGSMLFQLSFLLGLYLTLLISKKEMTKLLIAALGCVLAIILVAVISVTSGDILRSLLALDDPLRGIDSGGSGRLELWSNGVALVTQRPLFGWGMKANMSALGIGVHSGIISLFVDFGAAAMLIIVLCISKGISCIMREISRPPGYRNSQVHIGNLVAGNAIFSYLVLAIYEPLFFNFGNIIALTFMFCLMYSGRDAKAATRQFATQGAPVSVLSRA